MNKTNTTIEGLYRNAEINLKQCEREYQKLKKKIPLTPTDHIMLQAKQRAAQKRYIHAKNIMDALGPK